MKDLIIRIFGVYEPVESLVPVVTTTAEGLTDVEYYAVVASGAAGVDWAWVMGVLLFAIVLYSLFRILGVFFK